MCNVYYSVLGENIVIIVYCPNVKTSGGCNTGVVLYTVHDLQFMNNVQIYKCKKKNIITSNC